MIVERRKQGVWAIVGDDLFRKLVAIGLAILLWFFINSRIMDSETFTLPLVAAEQLQEQGNKRDSSEFVVFLPPGVKKRRFLDGDQDCTTIEVKLSGPRYKIDALKSVPLRLKVMTLLGRKWSREGVDGAVGSESDLENIEISVADIERDIRRDDITIEMIPNRVRMEVQVQDAVTIPLTHSMVVFEVKGGDKERMRQEEAVFFPPEITLIGPAKVLTPHLSRTHQPFQVELSYGPQENSAVARLTVIDGTALGIYPDGDAPQVTMPLNAERLPISLDLPLLLRDKRSDQSVQYEAALKSVPVTVSFAGGLRRLMQGRDPKAQQQWAADNLRLEVYLRDRQSGLPLLPELDLLTWLLPEGTLLHRYPNNEYLLEESLTVTVRVKK